ncbi:MAG: oligosaccharide flippase family protein [Rhodoferax sp.]|nr:oligosaccharide flippase family protein [Rhodoferax sp.]
MGPAKFGLIGFVLLLQAVLGLIDAGVSQALLREFSIRLHVKTGSSDTIASFLLSFERMYWMFALSAGLCVVVVSEFILSHWIDLGGLPHALGQHAVFGAAAIFAFQFPGSIYRSLMISAQQQVKLNSLMVVGSLIRHAGGAVLVIAYPTVTAYLIWHASTALLETLARAALAWHTLGVRRSDYSWNAGEVRRVTRSVMALSGVTWLGALAVQMDRIIVSKMVSVEQFGYYTLASAVSVGLVQIIYPLVQTALPNAMQMRADFVQLHKLYVKLWWKISALVFICCIAYVLAGEYLLGIWLKDRVAMDAVYPAMSWLLIGTALNAFYNVGYLHWLVQKRVIPVLWVNGLGLLLSMALIPPLVTQWGIMGAASGWISINLIGCVFSLEWMRLLNPDSSVDR